MKTVIVGCGRVGAELAEMFDRAGHEVIVLDTTTRAFDRLAPTFTGSAVRGDGTDEDTLRRAGAEDADVFLALTEGDNRNVMAAQVAAEALRARQVIAKINDPLRAAAYADLGLATLCRTVLMRDAVADFLGMPTSNVPAVMRPTGIHHGGEHHQTLAEVDSGAEGTGVGGPGAPGAGGGGQGGSGTGSYGNSVTPGGDHPNRAGEA